MESRDFKPSKFSSSLILSSLAFLSLPFKRQDQFIESTEKLNPRLIGTLLFLQKIHIVRHLETTSGGLSWLIGHCFLQKLHNHRRRTPRANIGSDGHSTAMCPRPPQLLQIMTWRQSFPLCPGCLQFRQTTFGKFSFGLVPPPPTASLGQSRAM